MPTDAIRTTIEEIAPEYARIRHHLHQNPELSGQEQETSAFVAQELRKLGIDEMRTDVGGHGIIAQLNGSGAGPIFALRADMDALPIQEESTLPYKSCKPGVMHACGHDGHTANLLGTAATLARMRDRFTGSIRFIFQPAEETVHGAEGMCEAGAMEGVGAIVALHGWPGMAVGKIGVRPGPMMASSDTFEITVLGRGAHAAQPHNSVDPIVVGAQIVMALQTLASREISPVDPVVVTVGQFNAGTAHNIIPFRAEMRGTVRCLTTAIRDSMSERLERIVGGICAAFRAEYTFKYRNGTPVTVNDAGIINLVSEVGAETLGSSNVVSLPAPSMGAEDFAVYLHYAPGAMFRLGVGENVTPLHTPTYNFSDDAMAHGMEMFTRTALRYLKDHDA
jgi:amidohydrolase